MRAIGIYGGTFDPVHYGHLRTALEVKESLGLDELRFLPCRHPPHRGAPSASPAQRLAMLELALAEAEPGFILDTRELERDGPSYMVDTLISLRTEYPHSALYLILGMDAFRGLPTWHRWKELLTLAHLVIMGRPNGEKKDLSPELARLVKDYEVFDVCALKRSPAGCLYRVAVSQLAISATQIRQLVASGRNPRYLLPEAVRLYLRANRLYLT